jgi:hypothetical protein
MATPKTRGAWLGLSLMMLTLAVPVFADPQSEAEALFTDTVNAAADLNKGEQNSLLVKIGGAVEALQEGKNNPAISKLAAFINEVQALQNSGRLPAEVAQPLVDAAEAILAQLPGHGGGQLFGPTPV